VRDPPVSEASRNASRSPTGEWPAARSDNALAGERLGWRPQVSLDTIGGTLEASAARSDDHAVRESRW